MRARGTQPTDPRVEMAWHGRDSLGEGPVWDERTQLLHRVDVLSGTVRTLDLAGDREIVYDVGQPVGCVALRADGHGLLLAMQEGFGALDLQTGEVELLAPVPHDTRTMQLNDGGCDPAGRFLAGSISRDASSGTGILHRYDPPGRTTPVLDGIGVSNGMAWTSAGSTLLFVDSLERRVDAFDYDVTDGTLSGRRVAFDLSGHEGIPDGIAVDAEDCLWVAFWRGGTVRRFAADGAVLDEVKLPVHRTTSCCLGGPDLTTLFVTTARRSLRAPADGLEPLAGAVFAIGVDVPGIPASRARL